MASLFISYSRKDITIARKLANAFTGHGLDFWIDWEGIPPTVDWWHEIEQGIEQADCFLFLLSPDSVQSKVCTQEIEYAVKNGKRLIPVVVRDIKAGDAHQALQSLNWIFARESDDFTTSLTTLITAIKTDYEWMRVHRELQVKALEWERTHREKSFLLHDKELAEVEFQLVKHSSKEPHPTDLQREYVLLSRQAANQQRKNRTRITTVVAIALAGLAIFGFAQARLATNNEKKAVANEGTAVANAKLAEERANIATARNAAIQSIDLRDEQLDVALLLGVEANKRLDNYETRSVLFDNLRYAPRILRFQEMSTTESKSNEDILRELAGADFPILTVSPDGKIGATGSERTIKLWDVASKRMIGELNLPASDPSIALRALAFSRDGTKLASGTDSGELDIWDVPHQSLVSGPVWVEDFVSSISFSNDGTHVAVGQSTDNVVGVYDVSLPSDDPTSEQPFAQPTAWLSEGHDNLVNQIAFSPDDSLLASGDAQGKVVLWDLDAYLSYGGGNFLVLKGHTDSIVGLKFQKDGKTLLSTDAASMLISWSVGSGELLEKTIATTTLPQDTEISPDGKQFSFKDMIGQIVLLNIETLRTIDTTHFSQTYLNIDPSSPNSQSIVTDDTFLGFDPNNNILSYTPESGIFTLWDTSSQTPISHPLGPQVGVVAASFSKDGAILATGNEDGTIMLSDLQRKSSIGVLKGHTAAIMNLIFVPTKNVLVSSSADHQILFWDLDTQTTIHFPLESNGVMAVSPNGMLLAYGDINGVPILFDLEKYEAIGAPLLGHKGIYDLSFNQGGNILASSGSDSSREVVDPSYNNVILWDVASQHQIGQTIRSSIEGGGVTAFTGIHGIFSSDDRTLIVYDNLGNITLWNINVNAWVDRSCDIAGRNFTQEEWANYFPNEEYQKTCDQWSEGH